MCSLPGLQILNLPIPYSKDVIDNLERELGERGMDFDITRVGSSDICLGNEDAICELIEVPNAACPSPT